MGGSHPYRWVAATREVAKLSDVMRRRLLQRVLTWRALGSLTALGLGGFHLDLLVRRFADGSLFEPAVAAQWVGALILGGVAYRFVRARTPLASGRRALAFWLLVLVLHALPGAPAALDGGLAAGSPSATLGHAVLAMLALAVLALTATSSPCGLTPRHLRVARARIRARRGFAGTGSARGPPV